MSSAGPAAPARLLTIAGSDSGGGAGIQADLKTFAAHGAYGMSAITAVTAQNTRSVTAVHALPPELVAAQIDAVFDDLGVDGVKIGMLAEAAIVRVVADRLRAHGAGRAGGDPARRIPVVLDPVMVAKSGDPLLADDAVEALRDLLVPLATVVTPNLPEAERLTGMSGHDEATRVAMGRRLAEQGPAVLVKGGHAEGEEVIDLLIDGAAVHRYAAPRIATAATHGTGCTLSSAIAARLAAGEPLAQAVRGAIDYLRRAMSAAPGLGSGHGPVAHGVARDVVVGDGVAGDGSRGQLGRSGVSEPLDLLVVGAGPTGIAIGAEARRRGLDVLLVEAGTLTAAIQQYPTDLTFFTTRDRLEIADVPFTVPEDKPSRRQALVYYRSVVDRHEVPVALHEEVTEIAPPDEDGGLFTVTSVHRGTARSRRARAVAVATGYFFNPDRLGVPGEDLPWVSPRYHDPYRHAGEHVVVVGAGNTAAEAALDMWRNGVRVTLVHRGHEVRRSVKYWVKPDLENRIGEGSIAARWGTAVAAFREEGDARWLDLRPADDGAAPVEALRCDAAYVFIGYEPDVRLQVRAGAVVDPDTLVPVHDPETCETNVPGLYVAGTLQAGKATDRIFIENSREHAPKIVTHLLQRLSGR